VAGDWGVEHGAEVAAKFGLGEVIGSPKPVARGAMGEVWRVETVDGRWALKALFDWAQIENVEVDLTLQEAAADAGVPLPRPVRSTAERAVEVIDGRRCRVFEWADLGPPPPRPASTDVATRLGTLLATIHTLSLPGVGAPLPWLTQPPPRSRWEALAEAAQASHEPWAEDLDRATPALRDLGAVARLESRTTAVLCHCDLIPDNVTQSPTGDLVVIDWEHAGRQPPEWEVGYVLVFWCLTEDRTVHGPSARALVDAYHATADRRLDLGPWMFAGVASALLNTASAMAGWALRGDSRQRGFGLRNLRPLLEHPVSPRHLDRLLAEIG
jgi:Ser/Thr protein kinase RdoA (MazF antagonist)